MLEVGVDAGGSLELWCELWPNVERVVGVDINPAIEGLHDKVKVYQADQTDGAALGRIGSQEGPYDLVIDDASHLREASRTTYQALFPQEPEVADADRPLPLRPPRPIRIR
jgi:hypothetical protein